VVSARTREEQSRAGNIPVKPAPTASGVVVKGILNSPRLQQAMLSIEGVTVTLERGQTRRVRLGGKEVQITCDSITDREVELSIGSGTSAESMTLSFAP
jgi:hypothetical protein